MSIVSVIDAINDVHRATWLHTTYPSGSSRMTTGEAQDANQHGTID
jgi:hypothetical protein